MRSVIKRLSLADFELARARPLGWIIQKCPHCGRKYIQQVVIDKDATEEGVMWNTKTGGRIQIFPPTSKKLMTLKEAKAKLSS